MRPCIPLAMILVFNPRPNSPTNPSVAITSLTACTYVTPSVCDFWCALCWYFCVGRRRLVMVVVMVVVMMMVVVVMVVAASEVAGHEGVASKTNTESERQYLGAPDRNSHRCHAS